MNFPFGDSNQSYEKSLSYLSFVSFLRKQGSITLWIPVFTGMTVLTDTGHGHGYINF